MTTEPLVMWTIYDGPNDYPGCFVARRYEVVGEVTYATDKVITSSDITALREVLVTRHGMSANLGREAGDDPVIVETWV